MTSAPDSGPEPTHGADPDKVATGTGWLERVVGLYPLHQKVLTAGVVVLVVSNALTRAHGLWAFWPLAVWGCVFVVHYLVVKTVTIDPDWVEERSQELNTRSYDRGHIETIAERNEMKTDVQRALEREREEYRRRVLEERRRRAQDAQDGSGGA